MYKRSLQDELLLEVDKELDSMSIQIRNCEIILGKLVNQLSPLLPPGHEWNIYADNAIKGLDVAFDEIQSMAYSLEIFLRENN